MTDKYRTATTGEMQAAFDLHTAFEKWLAEHQKVIDYYLTRESIAVARAAFVGGYHAREDEDAAKRGGR